MVHGTVHLLFRVLGGVLFLVLLAVGGLAWVLSQGALPLDRVTPYLEDAFNTPDAPFTVRLGGAEVRWEGSGTDLDLRVRDVQAVDVDGTVLAHVPEASLALSPRALLRGQIRPASVGVISPHVELRRDAEGTVHFGLWTSAAEAFAPPPEPAEPAAEGGDMLLASLLNSLGERRDGPLADLTSVRLMHATAEIIDEQKGGRWRVSHANVELLRAPGGRVDGVSQLIVELPDGHMRLRVSGSLHLPSPIIDLDAAFDDLRPAAMAALHPALEPLAALDLPLSGGIDLTLGIDPHLTLHQATVTLRGGAGTLRLPPPVDTAYPVRSLDLRASATAEPQSVLLERLNIVLGAVPGVSEGDAPPEVSLSGSFGPAVVDVEDEADSGPGYTAELIATARAVPTDALAVLWPATVAKNARSWVTERLSGGRVVEGQWRVTLSGPTLEGLDVDDLRGSARAEGISVNYLPPMPPATGAVADVSFTLDTLTVAIKEGRVDGVGGAPLMVRGGAVALTGLDRKESHALINLDIEGGLREALTLIDSPPLGYTTKLGVSPAGARGQARVDLRLNIPLLADLKLDQIEVSATATIRDGFLPGAVFGRDLSEAELTLEVDTRTLEARGQAHVGGVPAGFAWREVFSGTPFRSRYLAQAVVEEDKREVFGLDFPPFVAPYLRGPVTADIDFTVFGPQLSTLGAALDLAQAEIFVPGFDWTKAAGVPGQANLSVRLAGDTVREVPTFTVRAAEDDLVAEGRVQLHEDGSLDRITFSRLDLGESRLDGQVALAPDGVFDVDVRGAALDAVPFLSGTKDDSGAPERAAADDPGNNQGPPPMRLRGAFDVVWLADAGTLEYVTMDIAHDGDRWLRGHLDGRLEGRTPLTVTLLPEDPATGHRVFRADTEDAGALLRSFDLIDTVRGGTLTAEGAITRDGVAKGDVRIADYRLAQAPVLAQLLSVAALTGIMDGLHGEGLAFQTLEAPFRYDDGVLTLRNFRTYGSALGLTADGTVNLRSDRLTITGTLIPAYAVNSLFGRLPLIGGLLSGFEEGGGMFAMSYAITGSKDRPAISVNPLSTLAPGFLRNIFGGTLPQASEPATEPAPNAPPPTE